MPSKPWDCRWAAMPSQHFARGIRMLAACMVDTLTAEHLYDPRLVFFYSFAFKL